MCNRKLAMAECVKVGKCDKAERTHQVDCSSADDDEAERMVVQAMLMENECVMKSKGLTKYIHTVTQRVVYGNRSSSILYKNVQGYLRQVG